MAQDIFAELQWRGLIHQVTDPGLGKLLAGEPFTAYCGFDPTAPSLTTAHLLQILTLRRLQLAGHRPIALGGGGTGLIGDPSGRESERTLLSAEEVESNLERIRLQLERLLDFTPGSSQAQLLNNADWIRPLSAIDFLRDLGKHFSLNQMIAKESVRARLEEREQGISFAELSYMVLQSYDFLYLFDRYDCRLQLGGSDQWGNITAGIDLIRRKRGAQAYGLTTPLLVGPTGKKMSKSEGGAVWLDPGLTSSYRFYQFWMGTEDALVIQFLKFFTFLGREKIEQLAASMEANPGKREAQITLAEEMTTLVHGPEETQRARIASKAMFGTELSELEEATLLEVLHDVPSSEKPRSSLNGKNLRLVDLMVETGLAGSKAEARSHISGGGAYVNNHRETDIERALGEEDLVLGKYLLLRRGKKTHHLVRIL